MTSSRPRTNNDRLPSLFSNSLLLFFITFLASTTALANANAVRFPPSPSSSSSSPPAGQTPDAKTTNSLTGSRYIEKPPRDPPNTVYLAIEVATTDQPSPRATTTLIKKVFLLDHEQVEDESEDTVSTPGSLGSSDGSRFDANAADDDSRRYDPGPIIRIGKLSFGRTIAIFETQILLNPPEGTTCTLDTVERQKLRESGRFQTVDRMREQSDAMSNSIPSKYKPLMKLATGVTCTQRQVD